jgi:HEAT repeat protein
MCEAAAEDRLALEALIADLSAHEGDEREVARERLVAVGGPAIPALAALLKAPRKEPRWEAAKALGEMRHPMAAAALVDVLEDRESSVRWLAARGLIALGRPALAPLLERLERGPDSVWLRDGAHHVLRALDRDRAADEARPVLEALERPDPTIEVPVAAHHALMALRARAALDDGGGQAPPGVTEPDSR